MQSVYFVQISKRRQPSGLNKKKYSFFFLKLQKTRKITATEEAEKEKISTWGQVTKARHSCTKAAVLASIKWPHLPAVSKIEP